MGRNPTKVVFKGLGLGLGFRASLERICGSTPYLLSVVGSVGARQESRGGIFSGRNSGEGVKTERNPRKVGSISWNQ
jgi:hypothetical protein